MPRARRGVLRAVAAASVGLAGCNTGHSDPGEVEICEFVAINLDDRSWYVDVELVDGNRIVYETMVKVTHDSQYEGDGSTSLTDDVSDFRGSLVLRARLRDGEWHDLDLAEAASGAPTIAVLLELHPGGRLSIFRSTNCPD